MSGGVGGGGANRPLSRLCLRLCWAVWWYDSDVGPRFVDVWQRVNRFHLLRNIEWRGGGFGPAWQQPPVTGTFGVQTRRKRQRAHLET